MDYIELISNVGFPIAIAVFSLLRLESVVKSNTDAIHQLREEIRLNRS